MEIGIGKDQIIWVKKQTAKGTPAWPSAADAVRVTGNGKFVQDLNFYKSKEKELTLGETGRLKGLYKAGEFSFPCYIRASGSLGVVPSPAPVFESLAGYQTITANASVKYTPYKLDDIPVYLTVLAKVNFITMLVWDLVVCKGSFPIIAGDSDAAIVEGNFSGNFLSSLIAGTDATAALAAAAATAIVVVDARKFEVGQKIIVGTSGAAAGHLITNVVVATNTLTIAAGGLASEQASGVVVKGWTPVATVSGILMHGRFGKYQEAEGVGALADVLITQATLDIDSGWKLLNDEKNDSAYGSDFAAGDRVVTCKISRYVRKDLGAFRYKVNNQTVLQVKLPAADGPYSLAAGKRMMISLAHVEVDPPSESGDAERKAEIVGHAFDTVVLDDVFEILFD